MGERSNFKTPKGDVSVIVHSLIVVVASNFSGRCVLVLCFHVHLLLYFLVLQPSC